MKKPKTHDYTRRGWGHDYVIDNVINKGERLDMMGWGNGISDGDYLIIQGDGGSGTTRYQVEKVKYMNDPKDMWSITAKFAPRPKP